MGAFCSKENSSSGQQQHHCNQDHGKNRFAKFGDDYHTLEQVTDALSHAGLESSNLIVGIDFTKSNEWTGKVSFNNRSLHAIGDTPNPYEQAISIIGRTLARFDEDNLIPCFGFGDATTHDQTVFSFFPENQPCDGFEQALGRYREIVPQLRLAGPTSFAPMIETAIGIVDSSGGQYHVLLIIADGQVTRSVDTGNGQLSPQERETIDAIVKASDYPLSIVLVGVGDGPWDMMKQFDDNIPSRAFDNFQFVNFTEIMSRPIPTSKKEAEFALSALMEIPAQFKATMNLQLLGKRRGFPHRAVLPPPAKFKARSIVTMILFFCLTTPVGIAIGFGISRVYNENSPTALVVEGSLNSVAAGILIYMALVDLLAEDFMNPKVQSRGKLQLGINVSMLVGAGLMSMLAKWA